MVLSWKHGVLLGSILVGVVGCAGVTASSPLAAESAPAAGQAATKKEDPADKRAEVESRLRIAQSKLAKADMDLAADEVSSAVKQRHLQEELSLAEAKLTQYQQLDAPNRLAEARLSLQSSKDRAQEARDELAEIAIMYEDQDLNDRTAEFVVGRGKRNAARAAARIKIQERQLESLEEHTLVQERRKLMLDVDRKKASLEKAGRDAESSRLSKEISIMSARAEVAKVEKELRKLSEEKTE